MTDIERKQIRLILDDLLDCGKTWSESYATALFTSQAAKGLLHSGATVKIAAREMEEAASNFVSDATDKAGALSMGTETFAMINATVDRYIAVLSHQFEDVIAMVDRSQVSDHTSALHKAAWELFAKGEKRVRRQLGIPGPASPPAACDHSDLRRARCGQAGTDPH